MGLLKNLADEASKFNVDTLDQIKQEEHEQIMIGAIKRSQEQFLDVKFGPKKKNSKDFIS